MAKDKITQPILDAIDTLVDKKINSAGYDRTVKATVVQCLNPLTGKHIVDYEGTKFTAYSQNGIVYNTNDEVYIIIPANDLTMDKQIIGKQNIESSFIATTLEFGAQYDVIDNYSFNKSGTSRWNLNKLIIVPSTIQTVSYILEFELKVNNNNYNDKNIIDYKIVLYDNANNNLAEFTIDDVQGNPYYIANPILQRKVFNIDLSKLSYIKLEDSNSIVEISDVKFYVVQDLTDPKIKDYWIFKEQNGIINANKEFEITENNPTHKKYWIQFYDAGKQVTNEISCYWSMENSNVNEQDRDSKSSRYSSFTGLGYEVMKKTSASIDGSQDYFLVDINTLPYNQNNFQCVLVKNGTALNDKEYFIINNEKIAKEYKLTLDSPLEATLYEYWIDNEKRVDLNEPSNYDTDKDIKEIAVYKIDKVLAPILSVENLPTNASLQYSWNLSNPFGSSLKQYQIGVAKPDYYIIDNVVYIVKQQMPLNLKVDCEAYLLYNITGDRFSLADISTTLFDANQIAGYRLAVSNASQAFYYNGIYEGVDPRPLEVKLYHNGEEVPANQWKLNIETPTSNTLITEADVDNKNKTISFKIKNVYNYEADNQIKIIAENISEQEDIATITTSFVFLQLGDPGTNGTKYIVQIVTNDDNKTPVVFKQDTSTDNLTVKITDIVTGDFLSPNSVEFSLIGNNNFIQAKVTYNDLDYYAYASIVTGEFDYTSGFNYVVYGSNGRNPKYKNAKFIATDKKTELTLSLGEDSQKGYLKISLDGKHVLITDKALDIADAKDGIIYQIIKAKAGAIEIEIPILLMKNRYEYAQINNWDGQAVEIGSTHMLSPMAGFGKKDSDNGFTGVVLGESSEKRNYGTEENPDEQTIQGIMAYNKGERTVLIDARNGRAEFGQSGKGQIVIDPHQEKALLYGGNYLNAQGQQTGKGMVIDLTTPEIQWGNGALKITEEGVITSKSGRFEGLDSKYYIDLGEDTTKSLLYSPHIQINKDGTAVFGNIDGNQIVINADGSVSITAGVVPGTGQSIAGLLINEYSLTSQSGSGYVGISSSNSSGAAFWAGKDLPDKTSANGASFKVTHEGELYSTSGEIANFIISENGLQTRAVSELEGSQTRYWYTKINSKNANDALIEIYSYPENDSSAIREEFQIGRNGYVRSGRDDYYAAMSPGEFKAVDISGDDDIKIVMSTGYNGQIWCGKNTESKMAWRFQTNSTLDGANFTGNFSVENNVYFKGDAYFNKAIRFSDYDYKGLTGAIQITEMEEYNGSNTKDTFNLVFKNGVLVGVTRNDLLGTTVKFKLNSDQYLQFGNDTTNSWYEKT